MPEVGSLEVITGCVKSGKTEALIIELKRAQIGKQTVLAFIPQLEGQPIGTNLLTFGGMKFPACQLAVGTETPEELVKGIKHDRQCSDAEALEIFQGVDVVAFDQGHLFDQRNLPELCMDLVAAGKKVIVAGLDLDFNGKPFMVMAILMAMAPNVTKLLAVCLDCGSLEASRSHRLNEDDPRRIALGADHRALCLGCFLKATRR